MHSMTSWIWGAALTLALATCGDKLGETTSAGSATGETTTTDSGSDGAASATADTPTSGSTGAPACDIPPAAGVGPPVTVTVRNAGAAPIFIVPCDTCDHSVLYGKVGDAFGGCLRLLGPDMQPFDITGTDPCDFRCSAALFGKCGCGDGCGYSGHLQLDPGASFQAVWSGGEYGVVELPLACYGECGVSFPELAGGCEVSLPANPGVYTFVATATPERWSGPEVQASVSFDYPAMTAVELVFP